MASFNTAAKRSGICPAQTTAPIRCARADCVRNQRQRRRGKNSPKLSAPRLVTTNAVSQDDMVDAEKRWNAQVREGKIRNITCKGAQNLMNEGWTLLDVRPSSEIQKAGIEGAVEVPVFVPDDSLDVGSLLKQMSAFGMGGWWLGGTHMEPNKEFLSTVQQKIPKDAKLIVTCQKGLRSLAACEQLSRAGYQTLAWVNGGLDTCQPGDLPSRDGKDLRTAGIGGVSEMMGWTRLQQENKKGLGDNVESILKVAGVIVVADLLVLAYEQIKYMTSQ